MKEHPSVFVFDKKGRFIRAFGNQFQGGGHGIEVRQEGSEEFLYVCLWECKAFAKLTLKGETVWHKFAYWNPENMQKKKRRIHKRNGGLIDFYQRTLPF